MTETECILSLVDSRDAIEVMPLPPNLLDTVEEQLTPRIRLVQIQEQPQFHFLHSLLLLVVGIVFGFSLYAILKGL